MHRRCKNFPSPQVSTNFLPRANLRAGGLYLERATLTEPQEPAKEVKSLLLQFKKLKRAAGAGGSWALCALCPTELQTAGAGFGGPPEQRRGCRSSPTPSPQGSQTPGGSTFPSGLRLSCSGLCCCLWQNSSKSFSPQAARATLPSKARANAEKEGLHPKPTESSGQARNDFSSSCRCSPSVPLELEFFAHKQHRRSSI